MALRDRYQAREAERAKAVKDAEEKRLILEKRGKDRNTRDAYLYGLVFAAFANDDEGVVDDAERRALNEVGDQLQLKDSEVDEDVRRVSRLNLDEKMELIRESVGFLDQADVAELFLCEFSEIWKLGGGSYKDLVGFLGDFKKWMPVHVVDEIQKKLDAAVAKRNRINEENKQNEVQTKLAAFYDTVNTFFLEDKITLGHLEAARKFLIDIRYEHMSKDGLWASIHKSYSDEVCGKVECKIPAYAKDNNSGMSKFATSLSAVWVGFATGFLSPFIVLSKISSIESDFVAKQRYIRRRAVWALACLYALGGDLNESSVYPFNQLLEEIESLPHFLMTGNGQDDYFWKHRIESTLCRWLNVQPL